MKTLMLESALEVSTKSPEEFGSDLSAFSLRLDVTGHGFISLESAFQGSKIYSVARELKAAYGLTPREAKALARDVNENDKLEAFEFEGRIWELEPKTWFYDWLYIRAISALNADKQQQITNYQAFTDIEFNPAKSFSCQAQSAAIAASLIMQGTLSRAVEEPDYLRKVAYANVDEHPTSTEAGELQQTSFFEGEDD